MIKGSKGCDTSHLDLIFVTANQTRKEAEIEMAKAVKMNKRATHDSNSELTRPEFVECLLRIAVGRHMMSTPQKVGNVVDALARLFDEIATKADRAVSQHSDQLRETNCYTEETDFALRLHEASLRMLYEKYSATDGSVGGKRAESSKLLSCAEWIQLCRDLEIIDEDLSMDDAKLIFVWSRMQVIDEDTVVNRQKLENLSFWDFLEAIVRAANYKALPTDEELEAEGHEDAFSMLFELKKNDRDNYELFLEKVGAREWWQSPRQPIARAVEHLLNVMMRTLNHNLGRMEMVVPKLSQRRQSDKAVSYGAGQSLTYYANQPETTSAANQPETTSATSISVVEGVAWLQEALTRQRAVQNLAAKKLLAACRGSLARREQIRKANCAFVLARFVKGFLERRRLVVRLRSMSRCVWLLVLSYVLPSRC